MFLYIMKIVKTDFVSGAKNAQGIVVIIDVFRAFSVACYCLHGDPEFLMPVGSVEDARLLKEKYPAAILVGERGGKKINGFDYGNSPTELCKVELSGCQIIHTTHAGTQGVVNAMHASEVLTGSFLNAAATARYILNKSPEVVTLVRMGWKAETRSDEDDLCAEYLEHLLNGEDFDSSEIKNTLRQSACSKRFFDPLQPWSPESDFDLCLDINRFDFIIAAVKSRRGFLELCKIPPS